MIFEAGQKRTATVRAVVFESTTGVTNISPEGKVTTR